MYYTLFKYMNNYVTLIIIMFIMQLNVTHFARARPIGTNDRAQVARVTRLSRANVTSTPSSLRHDLSIL